MLTRTDKELTVDKIEVSDECCKSSQQKDKHQQSDKYHLGHCCGKHNHDHHHGCKRQGEQD